jgi:multiple sugar transport system substrate-binding protein
MTPIRIAVRKFEPFERAIERQFEDFVRASGGSVRVEIESLELNPLHERLFARRGLADGSLDLAFLPTDRIRAIGDLLE